MKLVKTIYKILRPYLELCIVLPIFFTIGYALDYAIIQTTFFVLNPVPVHDEWNIEYKHKEKTEVKPEDPKEWILNEWDKVGQRDNANAIISCESRWDANAYNVNTNKTFDASYYQFNNIHIKSGLITFECLGDYKCQTQKAIEMWKKSGWKPWACAKILNIK